MERERNKLVEALREIANEQSAPNGTVAADRFQNIARLALHDYDTETSQKLDTFLPPMTDAQYAEIQEKYGAVQAQDPPQPWLRADDKLPAVGEWCEVLTTRNGDDEPIAVILGLPKHCVTAAQLRYIDEGGYGEWQQGCLASGIPLTTINNVSHWRRLATVDEALSQVHATPDTVQPKLDFQDNVYAWMAGCFPQGLYSNMTERGDRLLEEVLELLQSKGYDRTRISTLVDYVFGRPVGEPKQEVGGVMVTLAAYCSIAEINMKGEGERELFRITQPDVITKIRAKQELKNTLRFDASPIGPARQSIHYTKEALESFKR